MFGSKSENSVVKNTGKGSNITNQFVEGTVIHGDIKSTNDIRVDGTVIGTVQSNSKIAIGKTGKIEGEVYCGSADIEGKILGRLEVKDVLILKKTAIIEGDIISAKLVVEEGAKFNGTCSMGGKEMKQHDKKSQASIQKEAV